MNWYELILGCVYFLLPAAFANMAPVIVKKIDFLNYPVDFNLKLNNKRIFGKNKTFRGFLFGIIFSIIIIYTQTLLNNIEFLNKISIINYSEINIIILGFLFGIGALLGDLIESFIKRQINIKPGERFFFFDQVDWVLGSLIIVSFYIKLNFKIWILSILIMFVLHILVKHIGFFLKLESTKW